MLVAAPRSLALALRFAPNMRAARVWHCLQPRAWVPPGWQKTVRLARGVMHDCVDLVLTACSVLYCDPRRFRSGESGTTSGSAASAGGGNSTGGIVWDRSVRDYDKALYGEIVAVLRGSRGHSVPVTFSQLMHALSHRKTVQPKAGGQPRKLKVLIKTCWGRCTAARHGTLAAWRLTHRRVSARRNPQVLAAVPRNIQCHGGRRAADHEIPQAVVRTPC